MKYLLLFLLPLTFSNCKEQSPKIPTYQGEVVAKIAFGSCNKQDEKQLLWDDVVLDEADMWIWLGDNIYGDSPDSAVMKEKYLMQRSDPGYGQVREKMPIYGIWDDHDFGVNDGGKDFEQKDEMRDLMFEFLDVPLDNPAWTRAGGYQSYDLEVNELSVKLILLDSRYFRDTPIKSGNGYAPNLEGTILGAAQWQWLEKELNSVKSDLLIIGNGIQILPAEHRFEKWANFPNERKRLFKLLQRPDLPKTLLLSGDRHLTEVSKTNNGKIIYEITCSGMTHSYSRYSGEPNRYRVQEVVAEKNYGVLVVTKKDGVLSYLFESRGDKRVIHQEVDLVY